MAQLFGIYRAVVVSAADPTGQRRLLVTVPEVLGAAAWALPCVPARSRAMPRAGAVVWVQFEAGNAARPVWVGTRPGGA
jgi:Type VI secretion system/phage-baseplate injector OB domain